MTDDFDYSFVAHPARIAVYDNLHSSPRIIEVSPGPTKDFIGSLSAKVYEQAKEAGGSLPYSVIREICGNFIHAQFSEMVISILDNGNTIKFADHGPGIPQKEKAQLPGFSSATEEMKSYIDGVGAGLPIAKEYLSFSNGSLVIEDNLLSGSVVTISLEKNPSGSPVAEIPPVAPPSVPVIASSKVSLAPVLNGLSDREKIYLRQIRDNDSVSVTDLINATGDPSSTVHSNLSRLESQNLIVSINKRRYLTEAGKEIARVL